MLIMYHLHPMKNIYVVDLGIDKIMAYNFDSTTGRLQPSRHPEVSIRPGQVQDTWYSISQADLPILLMN